MKPNFFLARPTLWVAAVVALNGVAALAYDSRYETRGYGQASYSGQVSIGYQSQPDPGIGCDSYAMIAERQQREIDQFDRLILAPMNAERDRLARDLNREINRPAELEQKNRERARKIAELESDNLRREQLIAQEEQLIVQKNDEANAADAAGQPQRARQLRARVRELQANVNTRRKNTAVATAEISRIKAVIEQSDMERQEILNTPPSATELQETLREVEQKILNSADLKNEKIQDLRLSTNARNLCLSYGEVNRQNEELRARYDDLYNRCMPPR
ncbi:MAG: hypothetical protein NDJ89_05990 [Oligoflexia bacterium]|nr:hypothetical protein [Oligoflexia bacterium]